MQVQKLSEHLSYIGAIQLQTSAQLLRTSTTVETQKLESVAETLRARTWAQRLPKSTAPEVLQAIENIPEENSKARVADIITGNYTPMGYEGQTQTSLLTQAPEPRGLLKLVLDMVKEIRELLQKGDYKSSVHRFYQRDAEIGLKEASVSIESFAENLHKIVEASKPSEPVSVDFLAKPKQTNQKSISL